MRFQFQAGISLIEVLVTIAIVSILATFAAPGLQSMIENNQVRTVTDEFLSSIYRTRSEAAKRGYRVVMCASNSLQTDCDPDATNFNNGWILFTDYDQNDELGPDTLLFDVDGNGNADTPEEILYVSEGIANGYSLSIDHGNPGKRARLISYQPNGTPGGGGVTYVLSESGQQKSYITYGSTGRVRSCVGDAEKCAR